MNYFDESHYKALVENVIPFHKLLGIKLVAMEPGYAALKVPYKPELVGDPRTNRIHGGVISTVMDAAGGAVGFVTLSSPQDLISTIDLRVDYLYPGKPEDIVVEARLVKDGTNLLWTDMTAHHEGRDEAIAQGRGVYRVLRHNHNSSPS